MGEQRETAAEEFFAAARRGELLILRCGQCGQWVAPYSLRGAQPLYCPRCSSEQLRWSTASRDAVLVTWTATPPAVSAGGDGAVIVSGIAELAEGPWLPCLVDVPGDRLVAGLPVRIEFAGADGVGGTDGGDGAPGDLVPVCRAG